MCGRKCPTFPWARSSPVQVLCVFGTPALTETPKEPLCLLGFSWIDGFLILLFSPQAAARHQCSYLVGFHMGEFLQVGGDPEWLRGLQYAPQKLRNLNEINKILAHRPWLITKEHIEVSSRSPQWKGDWSLDLHLLLVFHTIGKEVAGLRKRSRLFTSRHVLVCASHGLSHYPQIPSQTTKIVLPISGLFPSCLVCQLLPHGW